MMVCLFLNNVQTVFLLKNESGWIVWRRGTKRGRKKREKIEKRKREGEEREEKGEKTAKARTSFSWVRSNTNSLFFTLSYYFFLWFIFPKDCKLHKGRNYILGTTISPMTSTELAKSGHSTNKYIFFLFMAWIFHFSITCFHVLYSFKKKSVNA